MGVCHLKSNIYFRSVFRLFLVNCYLLHENFKQKQIFSDYWSGLAVYIAMTRNNLCTIWIFLLKIFHSLYTYKKKLVYKFRILSVLVCSEFTVQLRPGNAYSGDFLIGRERCWVWASIGRQLLQLGGAKQKSSGWLCNSSMQ